MNSKRRWPASSATRAILTFRYTVAISITSTALFAITAVRTSPLPAKVQIAKSTVSMFLDYFTALSVKSSIVL